MKPKLPCHRVRPDRMRTLMNIFCSICFMLLFQGNFSEIYGDNTDKTNRLNAFPGQYTAHVDTPVSEDIERLDMENENDSEKDSIRVLPDNTVEHSEQPVQKIYVHPFDNDDDAKRQTGEKRWFRDIDGDGYGDAKVFVMASAKPEGYVLDFSDCDDADRYIHPNMEEKCNYRDDNCDGHIDEDVLIRYYPDVDHDTYGDASARGRIGCTPSENEVANNKDCDDKNSNINQRMIDMPHNGIDENCDGTDGAVWFEDRDGDGFGNPNQKLLSDIRPAGYVYETNDCDDENPSINPKASERCNQVDDNCNSAVDENVIIWVYPDMDADGYGNQDAIPYKTCNPNENEVKNNTDCNDSDSTIHPGVAEILENDTDENCDGQIDYTWYEDSDGDGFGNAMVAFISASQPEGCVRDNTDCNDGNADIHPQAAESACDDIDQDCDGHDDCQRIVPVLYVDPDKGRPNHSGESWEDALDTIQGAIDVARDGNAIWIKKGSYSINDTIFVDIPVAIYGGFEGTEVHLNQRDFTQNITTIFSSQENRCFDVSANNVRIDGFHVIGRTDDSDYRGGGGIYTHGLQDDRINVSIQNCRFDGNVVRGESDGKEGFMGGGAILSENSVTVIEHCDFSKNIAVYGGAVANFASNMTISASHFSGNATYGHVETGYGGAIYNYSSESVRISACTFSGNNGTYGGAVANYNSSVTITNSIFTGNTAVNDINGPTSGGGVGTYYGDITITNCTFYNNSATGRGGAFSILELDEDDSFFAKMNNSILWNNYGADNASEIYSQNSTLIVAYSNVEDTRDSYPGIGNINKDPMFADPLNGDLHLKIGSPCINAGNNDVVKHIEHDFEGDTRTICRFVDIGADEYRGYMVFYKIAYINPYDEETIVHFETLLNEYDRYHQFSVEVILYEDVLETDFSEYRLIVIGPESGGDEEWNSPDVVAHIDSFRKPILGMWLGGAQFFQQLKLFGKFTGSDDASMIALQPQHRFFQAIEGNGKAFQITKKSSTTQFNIGFRAVGPPSDVTLLGHFPNAASLTSFGQQSRYIFWGYGDVLYDLTNSGRKIFITALFHMAVKDIALFPASPKSPVKAKSSSTSEDLDLKPLAPAPPKIPVKPVVPTVLDSAWIAGAP